MRNILVKAGATAMVGMLPAMSFAASVNINGFGTAAAAWADSEVPYSGLIDDKISFEEDTRIGLQFSAEITPELTFTTQLLARGDRETYDVKADWAYVSYKFNDSVSVRAGRVKLPILLVSDYVEVGYAYPWIRPPEEIYEIVPFRAISGVDLPINFRLGPLDGLVQLFGGSYEEEIFYRGLDLLTNSRLLGANLSLGNESFKIRAGYLESELDISIDPFAAIFLPPGVDPSIENGDSRLYSIGLKLDIANIIAHAEYVDSEVDGNVADVTAWYATVGYRIGSFTPHVTVASAESEEVVPLSADQDSIAVGLRYELNSFSALKVEWKQVEPTGGTAGLFEPEPGESLSDDKIDVVSVGLDFVF